MKPDVLSWHAELDAEVEPHPAFTLYRGSAALLLIDWQERLGAAMPQEVFERAVRNVQVLVGVAKLYGLPVLASEQYPKGLGATVPEIRSLLPDESAPFSKMDFCCGHLPDVRERLRSTGRRQVIVAGMETHVCVFQTVRWLVEHGWFVHVVRDACCSRTKENWQTGLDLMSGVGATITSTEVVAFDLVGTAEDAAFREISGLVK